jgi:hypothetical protein
MGLHDPKLKQDKTEQYPSHNKKITFVRIQSNPIIVVVYKISHEDG